jgi:hypothetical protein
MSGLKLAIAAGLMMVGFAGVSRADGRCARIDENVSYGLKTWSALHSAYARFRQCDDGAIAEGFSEAVARLMIDHWTDLPQALPLFRSDRAFENWAVRHIDQTVSFEDSMKIEELAEKSCPAGAQKLCDQLVAALKPVPAC